MTRRLSRRTLIRALAAVPMTAGVAAGETAMAPGARTRHATTGAWTQHGAGGANTNATAERGPQYNQHTDWTVDLPSVDSAPLVADDTVFVLDVSGGTNQIHGLHTATGTERMTVSLDATVVSGVLAADSQRVYTAEVVSPSVHAFSVPAGTHAWQADLAGDDESDGAQPALGISGGFRTAPRLHDGRLYLVSRSGGPQGGGVVALDAETGGLDRAYPGAFSAFAVDADRLVGARGSPSLSEHGLVALDTATGERHWEYTTPGRPGQPTLGDDRVFVGTSENRIHAVGHGDDDWTAPLDGWAVSLTLGEQTLLAQTDESLVAFDTTSGTRLWDTASGDTRPVVANDLVYVGRENGFDAYELRSGEEEAIYRNRRLDGPLAFLSAADGSLFATAPRGLVLAVEERIRLRALLDL